MIHGQVVDLGGVVEKMTQQEEVDLREAAVQAKGSLKSRTGR
jgi:hypothetical protein